MKTKTKTKTPTDRALIRDVFGYDPIDWARYPDGKLSFISPTGQKFSYTQEKFENIAEAVKHERAGKKKLSRKKSKVKKEPAIIDLNAEVDAATSNKNKFGGRGG